MSQALVLAGPALPGTTVGHPGMGQLSVRVDAHGQRYLRLPTGSPANRALLLSLTISVCCSCEFCF
jgi:hypothetical protein